MVPCRILENFRTLEKLEDLENEKKEAVQEGHGLFFSHSIIDFHVSNRGR